MKRLMALIGYVFAVMAVPVVLAAFIGMNFWSTSLVKATGLTITPWFSGGEVVRSIDHGEYNTLIHRTVFDGLLKEKEVGFVQVDWAPKDKVPTIIKEEIDYDSDGKNDFQVEFDTANIKADIHSNGVEVSGITNCYRLKDRYMIRVELHKRN